MTNDKLADAFEKGTAWVGSTEDGFEGATDQIIAALRRSEPERNQCDGCARNLQLGKNGIHYELDGTPVMGCTAHLYKRQPESDKVLVPRRVLDAAWALAGFIKHNDYPVVGTMAFNEFVRLADIQDTELRRMLAAAEAEDEKS